MEKYDIEAYLNGELSAAERQAFEAELAANPALAKEVALLRQLTEDLGDAMLWERVSTARALPDGRAKWQWWTFAGAVLLFGGLLWYSLGLPPGKTEPPAAPAGQSAAPELPPAELQPIATDTPSTVPKNAPTSDRPIAINTPPAGLQPPLHPAPQLRGNNSADTTRKALLDALWYTDYPPKGASFTGQFAEVDALLQQGDFSKSYARLQLLERKNPTNDTLFFLKGYCLLERGKGGEALRYFDKIENETPFGKELLEWYRGLALLLLGDDSQAKKVFSVISISPAHSLKQQAQRALEILE